jgi:hypothetical protein
MGLGRRIARHAVWRVTPRPVRHLAHPVRTARHAVTPRPVRRARRQVFVVRHPVGAAEDVVLRALFRRSRPRR